MKHFKLTFLLIVLMNMVGTFSFAHNFEVNGICYNYNNGSSGSSVSVTYKGKSCYDYDSEYTGNVSIPTKVTFNSKSYDVTSIGNDAFRGCESLTKVAIPNSVISIGNGAFSGCSSLTSITIPSSVTSIGDETFSLCSSLNSVTMSCRATTIPIRMFNGCTSLNSISIPSSVTSICKFAFSGCTNLSNVIMPTSVQHIEYEAFQGCTNLTSINLPISIIEIQEYAFDGCTYLTTINIPENVQTIGNYPIYKNGCSYQERSDDDGFQHYSSPFYGCSSLKSFVVDEDNPYFKSIDGVLYNKSGDILYEFPKGKTGSYTVPSQCKAMNGGVLNRCDKLTSLCLSDDFWCPDGYSTSFSGKLIETIHIGKVLKGNIGGSLTLPNVKTITVDEDNQSWWVENGVLYRGDHRMDNGELYNKTLVLYPQKKTDVSFIVPEGIKYIGTDAMLGNNYIQQLSLPSSLTGIGYSALKDCSNLKSVNMPCSSIGPFAFENCRSLNSIDLTNARYLCESSFINCNSLKTVILGSSLENDNDEEGRIERLVFWNCTSITDIYLQSKNLLAYGYYNSDSEEYVETEMFNNFTATVHVPFGCLDAYKASKWKSFANIVEFEVKNGQSISLNELPSMTYGDDAYVLPEKTVEGLTLSWTVANASVAVVTDNILTIKGAGTTTVTATQAGNDEYESFERTLTLTVNKAPLTITANDCTKQEGEENPELTVSYEGFVNDDDASALTAQPTVTTTATTESPAGTYPITVSGAESDNYEITYVEGTLTVTEAPVLSSSSLYVNENTVRCGSQEIIPVVFESEIAYGGLQCELTLPEGITLSKVTKTERLTDDFILQKNQTGDNTYQILLYNTSRLSFAGNDGALFTLTVDVDDEMAVGDYTLMLKDIVVSTIDEQQDDLPDFSGTIHVEDYMIGDANRDNRVNVTDIMAIANYILRIPGNNFNEKAADLNGDNRVNVTDIMGVANIILRVNTTQNAPWNGQMLDPQ